MASVLNRTTKQYLASANTADYPPQDWIVNPDLSAVVGFASKYWVIAGDAVSLMGSAARGDVDAAELDAARDTAVSEIDDIEAVLRAFANVVLDEINTLRDEHALAPRTLGQLRSAIRSRLGS